MLQRKDLNPLEKAASFQDYLERYQCTQEDLAGRLKIDRSTIANLIRLLELPAGVQDAVRNGSISQGHARALLTLGDEPLQLEFCQRIQAEALSVRATEDQVQALVAEQDAASVPSAEGPPRTPARKRTRSGQIAALEQELRTALGTKVDVRQTSTGRGKIIVHFAGSAEFERLRGQLCGDHARSKAG
jgi:ParB family chromosome partitioning protein